MLAFRCISSVSKGKIFSGHNFRRRSYASSAKDRSFGNAMQAVPITSASGKPSFRPKKLPPGRKRIPEQFLLPPEAPRASSARQLPRESSIDEEKEHAEWLSGLNEMNESMKGVSFSKTVKPADVEEEDARYVEKFIREDPQPESILPPGFFKTQQEIAKKKILSFPTHATLADPFVQRMRYAAKREDLMVDSDGEMTIYGFKVPGELAGYYEDPKGYRQEKAKAFEEKLQKLRARNSKKKKLVSSWRVDPEQPNFTRRQLRMASKIKSTLEDVIDEFVEKHAPILLSEGGVEIRDVTVSKDMRVATIVWESQMPEEDVKKFLERHLKVLRYQLTQALQPQKWSPELVLKSVKELEKEREPEIKRAQLVARLEKHVQQLEAEIAKEEENETSDPILEQKKRAQAKKQRSLGAKQDPKQRDDQISKIAKQMARNLVNMGSE